MKKYTLYLRAFMRIRTLLILLIVLVTVYVYQDKFRELTGIAIEKGREERAFSYFEGAMDKAKRIKQINESRVQRVADLAGNKKTIKEKTGLFEFEIPENWKVSLEQGSTKYQISKMALESPTFSKFNIGDDIFYDNGAQLTITVAGGVQASAKDPNGGHGSKLVRKENVIISGENAFYHTIKDDAIKEGETADAHVVYKGNTYHFLFTYNPKMFSAGEFVFQEMLNSFKFLPN